MVRSRTGMGAPPGTDPYAYRRPSPAGGGTLTISAADLIADPEHYDEVFNIFVEMLALKSDTCVRFAPLVADAL